MNALGGRRFAGTISAGDAAARKQQDAAILGLVPCLEISRVRRRMWRWRQERDALLRNAKVGQNIAIYFEAAVSVALPLALIDRKAVDYNDIDRTCMIVICNCPEQSSVMAFFGRGSPMDKVSVTKRWHLVAERYIHHLHHLEDRGF
jgi:hypothetical protein